MVGTSGSADERATEDTANARAWPPLICGIGRVRELHVHLTTDEIGQGESGAPIGHVDHVEAGHRREEFPSEMSDRAYALRSHIDLSRVCSGICDELGNRLQGE